MSEPRDTPAPYEPSRCTGSIVPPVPYEMLHGYPDRSVPWWIKALAISAACLLVLAAGGISRMAFGAEVPGRWEITLLFPGVAYDQVQRTHRTLAVYDSKTECDVMIVRVRVKVSGARLRCDPVETTRAER